MGLGTLGDPGLPPVCSPDLPLPFSSTKALASYPAPPLAPAHSSSPSYQHTSVSTRTPLDHNQGPGLFCQCPPP